MVTTTSNADTIASIIPYKPIPKKRTPKDPPQVNAKTVSKGPDGFLFSAFGLLFVFSKIKTSNVGMIRKGNNTIFM